MTPATDRARVVAGSLQVTGVRAASSLGIARYAERLAAALSEFGIDYTLAERAAWGGIAHVHVANSSRRSLIPLAIRRAPTVATVHDILPRDPRMMPVYRRLVHPLLANRAEVVIVHSSFAADMLRSLCPVRAVEVIPHPAPAATISHLVARSALGIPDGPPVAVLPGVLKQAKMTGLVLDTFGPLIAAGKWRLILAGRVADRGVAARAEAVGAMVIASPSDLRYEQAVAAADLVLVLRLTTVGETNGPLLDAIGHHRAVLASPIGSIPETAGGAARLVTSLPLELNAALTDLESEPVRRALELESATRASALTWTASAHAHAALFSKLADRA
jgi:glycosyltransferase involved in cell wall biosynthesis